MDWLILIIVGCVVITENTQEIHSSYIDENTGLLLTPLQRNDSETNLPMIDKELLIELIHGFHDRYKFQNIIFFLSEHFVLNNIRTARIFVNFWTRLPLVPIIVVGNKVTKIHGLINTPSLCIVLTSHQNDRIMSIASNSLHRLHNTKSIFVLWPRTRIQSEPAKEIASLYNWLWSKQFTNTLILTTWNNIYTLDPYPILTVINKTNNWRIQDFFVNYMHNMKGYLVYSPICYDLPRVFQTEDHEISGTSAKLMKSFLKHHNGSLVNDGQCSERKKQTIKMQTMLNQINTGHLEMSVHSIMQFFNTLDGSSYPLSIDDFCVIVPFEKKSPEHLHLRVILDDASWYLLIGSTIYLTITLWLCTPHQQRDMGKSFLQSICSLLSLAPLTLINIPTRKMRLVAVLLFILGFIFVNMYLSKLASRLTILMSDHQIDTVDDVISAQLHILVLNHEYSVMTSSGFPQEFIDLLIPVDRYEIDAHRESFNTTYGYTIQTDRWELLNMQQRYLQKPIFRVTSICLGPYYHVYPLRNESHLYSSLKKFIMKTQQSGLQLYWKRKTYTDILTEGYAKILIGVDEKKPLTLEFFYYIWIIWSIGLVISVIVFIMETIIYTSRKYVRCN